MESNQVSSQLAARISGFLFIYLLRNESGFLSSADGGCSPCHAKKGSAAPL